MPMYNWPSGRQQLMAQALARGQRRPLDNDLMAQALGQGVLRGDAADDALNGSEPADLAATEATEGLKYESPLSSKSLMAQALTKQAITPSNGSFAGALAQGLAGLTAGITTNRANEQEQRAAIAGALQLSGGDPEKAQSYLSGVGPEGIRKAMVAQLNPKLPVGYQMQGGQAGLVPGVDPSFAKNQKGGTTVSITNMPPFKGETKYQEGVGEGHAKQRNKIAETAFMASQTMPMFDEIEKAIPNASQGPAGIGQGAQLLRQVGESIGMEVDTSKIRDSASLEDYGRRIAFQFKTNFGPQISNADINLMLKMAPNLGQSEEANRTFVKTARKIMNDAVSMEEMAQEFDQSGRSFSEFPRFILERRKQAQAKPPEAPSASKPDGAATDDDIAFTAQKYGISPEEVKRRLGMQ